MTGREREILRHLARSGGTLRLGQLAERMGIGEDYCTYICRALFRKNVLRHRCGECIVLTPGGRRLSPTVCTMEPRKTGHKRTIARKRRKRHTRRGSASSKLTAAIDPRTMEPSVPPEIDRTIVQHIAERLSCAVQSAIRQRLRPSVPEQELSEINTSFEVEDETRDLRTNLDQLKEERYSAHVLGKSVKTLQALTERQ